MPSYSVAKMILNRDVLGLIEMLDRYGTTAEFHKEVVEALGILGDGRAVQPLIAALKDNNVIVRSSVAKALGNLGDARAVGPLIAALSDHNVNVRKSVTEALCKVGDARAVEPLVTCLVDGETRERVIVAEALGRIGDPRAIEWLVLVLQECDSTIRAAIFEARNEHDLAQVIILLKAVADALEKLDWQPDQNEPGATYWVVKGHWDRCVQLGSASIAPLIVALKDKTKGVRQSSAIALGQIGNSRAVKPLFDTLNDSESRVRQSAAIALGQIGNPWAVEPLLAVLRRDSDPKVRQSVAEALGQIGDNRAVAPLITVLKVGNEEKQMRKCCAEALSRLGHALDADIYMFMDGFKDDDEYVRSGAIEALIKIGEPAIVPLITALNDREIRVRQSAIEALVQIGGIHVVQALITALKYRQGDETACKSYAEALGRLGHALAAEIYMYIASFTDNNGGVQFKAIEALTKIGEPAILPLIDALNDSDSRIRQSAAETLGKIGDIRAVEPLINMLNDKDKLVCNSAVQALGRTHDTRAVDPLIEVLKDMDKMVCRSAAEALGQIGDARAIEPLIVYLERGGTDGMKALGKIGDTRAVRSIIPFLTDNTRSIRQDAAWALVALYQRKQLDMQTCLLILAQREVIEQPHTDNANHYDEHYDRHTTEGCESPDYFINCTTHDDSGIGVTFPL